MQSSPQLEANAAELQHPMPNFMFAYWGSKGAMPKLAFDLSETAALQKLSFSISVSRTNELFKKFEGFQDRLFPVETFDQKNWNIINPRRIGRLRRSLSGRIISDDTNVFVSLMSHVWSPFVVPVLRRHRVRHVVFVHDAEPHPGDRSAYINRWLLREAQAADDVVAFSHYVAEKLVSTRRISADKIKVLFLPDLKYSGSTQRRINSTEPLRVLFVGRILPYKGLDLLIAAAELLKSESIPIELGIYGSGVVEKSLQKQMLELGAFFQNSWINEQQFCSLLNRFDIVVAPHKEASQSGVISAALGAGLPVVTTPVGGLVEQVTPDVTGIIAEVPTAEGIAGALKRVAQDRKYLAVLTQNVEKTHSERSMAVFLSQFCAILN